MTSVRLLAVLNVGFKNVGARHAVPELAERRAPCTGGPLTHFASPPGEKSRLGQGSLPSIRGHHDAKQFRIRKEPLNFLGARPLCQDKYLFSGVAPRHSHGGEDVTAFHRSPRKV